MRHFSSLVPCAIGLVLAAAQPARAASLDRDSLLAEAPATPESSTFRVAGIGQTEVTGDQNQARVGGSILWAPFQRFAADLGVAWEPRGNSGPSARVRYQILQQTHQGIDLAGGVRFKMVGLHPDQGEVEFILAAGRSFGRFDLVVNGVFGVETSEEAGKDLELKTFAGYRAGESLRFGVDSRLLTELGGVEDAEALARPRDFEITAGPAFSWVLDGSFQAQALVGVNVSRLAPAAHPVGLLALSIDF